MMVPSTGAIVTAGRVAWVTGLCGILGACASVCEGQSTDPTTGGLVGGACGISSGSYAVRVEERQAGLEAELAESRRLDAEQVDAQRRLEAAGRQRAAVNQQLEAELAETERLSQALTARQDKTDDLRLREAELRRQIAAVEAEYAEQLARDAEAEDLSNTLDELKDLNAQLQLLLTL